MVVKYRPLKCFLSDYIFMEALRLGLDEERIISKWSMKRNLVDPLLQQYVRERSPLARTRMQELIEQYEHLLQYPEWEQPMVDPELLEEVDPYRIQEICEERITFLQDYSMKYLFEMPEDDYTKPEPSMPTDAFTAFETSAPRVEHKGYHIRLHPRLYDTFDLPLPYDPLVTSEGVMLSPTSVMFVYERINQSKSHAILTLEKITKV